MRDILLSFFLAYGLMQPFDWVALQCSDSECRMGTTMGNGTAAPSHAIDEIECEWSEHVSPDGDMYYYNCITCESRVSN